MTPALLSSFRAQSTASLKTQHGASDSDWDDEDPAAFAVWRIKEAKEREEAARLRKAGHVTDRDLGALLNAQFGAPDSCEDLAAYNLRLWNEATQRKKDAMEAIIEKVYETEQSPGKSLQNSFERNCSVLGRSDYRQTIFDLVTQTISASFRQLHSKIDAIPMPTDAESRERLRKGYMQARQVAGVLLIAMSKIDPEVSGKGTGKYTDGLIGEVQKLKDDCTDRRSRCIEDIQPFIKLIEDSLSFCITSTGSARRIGACSRRGTRSRGARVCCARLWAWSRARL